MTPPVRSLPVLVLNPFGYALNPGFQSPPLRASCSRCWSQRACSYVPLCHWHRVFSVMSMQRASLTPSMYQLPPMGTKPWMLAEAPTSTMMEGLYGQTVLTSTDQIARSCYSYKHQPATGYSLSSVSCSLVDVTLLTCNSCKFLHDFKSQAR